MGRARELIERNGSHKRSRNYSRELRERTPLPFGFWFLVCYVTRQLANQLHQTRIQVVRSNKVAGKCLTESNDTPAMDLGHMNVVLK